MQQNVTDMMGRKVLVPTLPMRIVSLVPSQTELLYSLGLGDRVVGITKFCVHPKAWYAEKPKVGGTKTLNMGKIADLQPDLIIGNKEENEQGQVEDLMQRYAVWMSDINTLADACKMIAQVGALTGRAAAATAMVTDIGRNWADMKEYLHQQGNLRGCKVAYFIWRKPYMVAGKGTFIDAMLSELSLVNVFGHLERYPQIAAQDLQDALPTLILLSSEPYPFKEKHLEEMAYICPEAKVVLVDGEYFSWYGSRLVGASGYFKHLNDILI